MSCPTCSHTMQKVCSRDATFWCPRCGTLKSGIGEGSDADAPKLVERCREFEKSFPPGNPPTVSYSDYWKRLGIAEAINKPEDRK